MKRMILSLIAMLMPAVLMFVPVNVYADCSEGQVETSILGSGGCTDVGSDGSGVFDILNIALTVMTFGVGILATIGIVWSGYVYLSAKDDVSKVQKAKDRIFQIVIGLAIWAMMWTVLQFLLPGGLLGRTS